MEGTVSFPALTGLALLVELAGVPEARANFSLQDVQRQMRSCSHLQQTSAWGVQSPGTPRPALTACTVQEELAAVPEGPGNATPHDVQLLHAPLEAEEQAEAAAAATAPSATMMSREARQLFLGGDPAAGLHSWKVRAPALGSLCWPTAMPAARAQVSVCCGSRPGPSAADGAACHAGAPLPGQAGRAWGVRGARRGSRLRGGPALGAAVLLPRRGLLDVVLPPPLRATGLRSGGHPEPAGGALLFFAMPSA